MFCYVALVWDAQSQSQTLTADALSRHLLRGPLEWTSSLAKDGLRIYHKGSRPGSSEPHYLARDAGVVFGTVFENIRDCGNTPTAKAHFEELETEAILRTNGRALVNRYWGRYVAFIFDESEHAMRVVRSPTGEIDCLYTDVRDVRVFFSRADHCPLLSQRSYSVNWDYVAADLCRGLPETRQTGLHEVRRILHGECLTLRRGEVHTQVYWQPSSFIREDPIDDVMFAARKLRETAQACIAGWAASYQNILAFLSGGLDSSIIVGILRQVPSHPAVTCLNYRYVSDSMTDERKYARIVASRAEFPLVEHEQQTAFSLAPLLHLPTLVSPCQPIFEIGDDGLQARVARGCNAEAYFAGHGGDQLFFQSGAYFTCADFIQTYGLRFRVLSLAMDAARMEGGALWPALRRGIWNGLRRDTLNPVISNYRFPFSIRPEVAANVRAKRLYLPEWLNDPEKIPSGKCLQVLGLSVQDDLHGVYAHEDEPENVFPLLSQPLQELCLRIPSHVLALGGRDRGLARHAFQEHVPADILNRATKGFIYDYVKTVLVQNVSLIKSLVFNGSLIKERIVDSDKVQALLSGDPTPGPGSATEIMNIASTEAWLRTWIARSANTKAA